MASLRDVRAYMEQLNEAKIGLVDFFQESAYGKFIDKLKGG